MKTTTAIIFGLLLSSLLMTGCNSGGGSSNNNRGPDIGTDTDIDSGSNPEPEPSEDQTETPVTNFGQFLDSAVEGLRFVSGAEQGFTDVDGVFIYEENSIVEFYIGDILIGSTIGAEIITPINLVFDAIDENDPRVINIIRFLQTLDEDADPDNGIAISALVREASVGGTIDFDQTLQEFKDDGNVQILVSTLTGLTAAGPRVLVDSMDALEHFLVTLAGINGEDLPDVEPDPVTDDEPDVIDDEDPQPDNGVISASVVSTLTASGVDTDVFGTTLTIRANDYLPNGVGDITGSAPDLVSTNDVNVLALTRDIDVEITSFPETSFVLVSSPIGVSMRVNTNFGENSYLYLVTCPNGSGVPVNCANIDFDPEAHSVTFDEVTLVPSSSDTNEAMGALTIDGTIDWISTDERF